MATKNTRAEQGMFGLENIMKSFYNYEPDSDDEYGNYMKNTFASNMIQSAFDTQNSKDLAYTQAEISSGLMNQASELQRLSTKDIMRKEYQYGSDMMKQQFQYQNQFADDQYSRDLGTIGALGENERALANINNASKEKIAFGRYDADKYISDNQLTGTKYTADQQLAGVKDTNRSQLEGTKYTADSNLAGIKDTNKASITNTDRSSTAQENVAVTGKEGLVESTKIQSEANINIAGKQLEGSKYTADKNLSGIQDTNRTSTENIRVTGDETRKTADNQQRLQALDRTQQHKMARSTARAF